MRGGGHASHAAVAAGEDVRHFGQGDFSLADLHQGSDDAPAHFVEKTVTLDNEGQLFAGFFEVATREGPDIRCHLVTARAGEAAEVVFADE